MSNSFIVPLYKKIFDEDFNYGDFGKRMKMQKCIYLLEQYGINVGEYDFTWYKHGPYSQRLQDDMYVENNKPSVELSYSDFASSVIERIKSMVKKSRSHDFDYTEEQWMECLASVHYLNRLFCGNKQRAIIELVNRKSHLNNNGLNREAYDLVVSDS